MDDVCVNSLGFMCDSGVICLITGLLSSSALGVPDFGAPRTDVGESLETSAISDGGSGGACCGVSWEFIMGQKDGRR